MVGGGSLLSQADIYISVDLQMNYNNRLRGGGKIETDTRDLVSGWEITESKMLEDWEKGRETGRGTKIEEKTKRSSEWEERKRLNIAGLKETERGDRIESVFKQGGR